MEGVIWCIHIRCTRDVQEAKEANSLLFGFVAHRRRRCCSSSCSRLQHRLLLPLLFILASSISFAAKSVAACNPSASPSSSSISYLPRPVSPRKLTRSLSPFPSPPDPPPSSLQLFQIRVLSYAPWRC